MFNKRLIFFHAIVTVPITAFGQGVGINQTSPVSMLDVNGGITVGSTYSGTNAAPADGMIVQGNVGIGTSSPATKLHVVNSGTNDGEFRFDMISGDDEAFFRMSNGNNWGLLIRSDANSPKLGAWTSGNLQIHPYSSATGTLDATKGALSTFDFANERVGIGTTSPGGKLGLSFNGSAAGEDIGAKLDLVGANGDVILLLSSDDGVIAGGSDFLRAENGGTVNFVIQGDGKVGIGSATPTVALDIVGELVINSTAADQINLIGTNDNNDGYSIDSKTALSSNDSWLRLNNASEFTSGVYTPLHFRSDGEIRQGSSDYGAYEIQTGGQMYVNDYGVFLGGIHVGGTSDPGTDNLVVDGNVGIGSVSPTVKLDVVGDISSTTSVYWGSSGIRTETRNDAGASGTGVRSGFYQTAAPSPASSWPSGASSWWHLMDIRHTNTANNYAMQFAGSFFDQDLYFRKTNNSASTSWAKVLTSANGGGRAKLQSKASTSSGVAVTTDIVDVTGSGILYNAFVQNTSCGGGTTQASLTVIVDGVTFTAGSVAGTETAYMPLGAFSSWTSTSNPNANIEFNSSLKITFVKSTTCGTGSAEAWYAVDQ